MQQSDDNSLSNQEQSASITSRSSRCSQMRQLIKFQEMLPNHSNLSESQIAIKVQDHYLIQEHSRVQADLSLVDSSSGSDCELMIKIGEMTHRILELEEQLFYYKSQCFQLMSENDKLNQNHIIHTEQINSLQTAVKLKNGIIQQLNNNISQQQQIIQDLKKENNQTDNYKFRSRQFDGQAEELKQQNRIITELTIKNQKILKINNFLQSQLRVAEDKLIELQNSVQKRMCSLLMDNVVRLKQNQNLINQQQHPYTIAPSSLKEHKSNDRQPIQHRTTIHIEEQLKSNRQTKKQFKTIQKERNLKNTQYPHQDQSQKINRNRGSNRYYSTLNRKQAMCQRMPGKYDL